MKKERGKDKNEILRRQRKEEKHRTRSKRRKNKKEKKRKYQGKEKCRKEGRMIKKKWKKGIIIRQKKKAKTKQEE